ncbi:Phosphatidylserine/phosphatidylglycerophosphate / cardiolipinsynthase-like protein [metagenome]|uniref:Phosphatidylserine/phosphatidylglycerophosphate / cardiolipinsynthase-like protein n=1 Tax=metagenome TaxID=256318 RepID=A0A2P2BYX5_9ZZZZ
MPLTDWLLTQSERANPETRLDDRHPDDEAWSRGNLVRPLIHGSTYFTELFERIEATRAGDLVFFTDWQGDADERLTGEPGSEVVEVLGRADERGVDVRGLVWRSHLEAFGFTSGENRRLGKMLQDRGAEALLDMRVRFGGSHHQKMVVIRHRDDPSRDIAYVGGIDLCHSRRDDSDHGGDPQALALAEEYGETPPWHDIQAAISGPAVHDVETVFRERWEDPTPLSRHPLRYLADRLKGMDLTPDPLPEQAPPPPPVEGGTHLVQLLRTYPDLRANRDYPFANGGERSVARGYSKALTRASRIIYVEDQYLWGTHVGDVFTEALRKNPDLRVIAVVPMHPDLEGTFGRTPQLLGRRRAMLAMARVAPDRVAIYGIENPAGTPVYVHAKCCIIDDTWTTIGSDNFNRRSWTHDSELSAVVLDETSEYAQRLRLTLAAEHLDRDTDDCVDPSQMYTAFEESAARLDAWHAGGQVGPRPPGRLRRLSPPELSRTQRAIALPAYLTLHDPDGRPRSLRRKDAF